MLAPLQGQVANSTSNNTFIFLLFLFEAEMINSWFLVNSEAHPEAAHGCPRHQAWQSGEYLTVWQGG